MALRSSRMSRKPNPSPLIFTGFVVLTFYSLGAGWLESFVNYPLWHIIGPTDRWAAYHQALGPRIVIVLAIPALLLSLIANVLLFFRRPPPVPLWTVVVTLALLLVAIVSTVTIQIPIQMQLDVAYQRTAVDRLMVTSWWLRDLPGAFRGALVGYMVMLAVAPSISFR
jgi:hypothetical protein